VNDRIRVAVVDDQPLLVSAFVALISHQPDLEVVGTGADGHDAIELCERQLPDVLLMDLRMPGLDGIEATKAITKAGSRPYVLVLTTFDVDDLVLGAVAAGARGYLLKDTEPATLLDGIRAVHRGDAVIDPHVAPHLLAAFRTVPNQPDSGVTPRELEVLRLIASGLTNAEIAAELVVAETTVKTHVGNLLLKLDARDRVALVVLAHAGGLVPSTSRIPRERLSRA
jgi:DNA-binding NarL/FixJ family response regulator